MSAWVKCSDRMPEMIHEDSQGGRFSDSVLVYDPFIEHPEGMTVRALVTSSKGLTWLDEEGQHGEPDQFTHWMPLPDPPE